MKIAVNWDNAAKTMLRCTFSGDWEWDDFYSFIEKQTIKSTDADHGVCFLIDLRPVTHIPSDAILHLKRAAELASEVNGLIVLIASSVEVLTMYRMFVTSYRSVGHKFRLAASDEEAHAACKSFCELHPSPQP